MIGELVNQYSYKKFIISTLLSTLDTMSNDMYVNINVDKELEIAVDNRKTHAF